MSNITMINIDRLRPHEDNPRKDLGDLSELTESIRQNGIYQNLTVVEDPEGSETYVVIIGHRRLAAAKAAGLTVVPCVISKMDYRRQIETMLIENMQRADLTVYEQARSFQLMLDLGSDTQTIAKNTGFSVATVKHRLKLAELDPAKLKAAADRQISLGELLELEKIQDLDRRNHVLEYAGTEDFRLEYNRALNAELIEKNLPIVQAALKEIGAKEISQREAWSAKYTLYPGSKGYIYLAKYGEPGNVIPDILPDEKIYYHLDDNSLVLYARAKKEKAPAESESPKEKKRKEALRKAWAEVDRLGEETYKLRYDWISAYKCQEGDYRTVLLYSVIAGLIGATSYTGASASAIIKALEIDNPIWPYVEQIYEKVDYSNLKQAAFYAYLTMGDDVKLRTASGSRGDLPYFTESPKLNIIYDYLVLLGYKASKEELQLLDGTHEIYDKRRK